MYFRYTRQIAYAAPASVGVGVPARPAIKHLCRHIPIYRVGDGYAAFRAEMISPRLPVSIALVAPSLTKNLALLSTLTHAMTYSRLRLAAPGVAIHNPVRDHIREMEGSFLVVGSAFHCFNGGRT